MTKIAKKGMQFVEYRFFLSRFIELKRHALFNAGKTNWKKDLNIKFLNLQRVNTEQKVLGQKYK